MYNNPYVNHLQYHYYSDMSQADIAKNAGENPSSQAASQNYINSTFQGVDPNTDMQFQSQPMKPVVIDPNAPTQKEMNQAQTAAQLNSGANSIIGAVPVYGQLVGIATAASGLGRGLLKKDEYGRVKGTFGQGADALMTPVHEQVLTDLSQEKYGEAALDVFTGGLYNPIKKWTS